MTRERKPLEQLIVRKGHRARPFTDAYAFLLRARWSLVIGLAFVAFLSVNALFALLYWAEPGSVASSSGSYRDCFFFSVQTFGAIGYGYMYSQTVWANVVVTAEAFVSLLCIAVLTGITFAKFSRPRARVLFSANPVIEMRDGVRTLSFRVANERANDVVEASIRVSALMTEHSREGKRLRRFHDLELSRSSTPVFILTWQIFHAIDESSPLFGKTVEQMIEEDVRIMVALTGIDDTFAQTIHARKLYWADELREGHRYVDVISPQPDGAAVMDFAVFHDTVEEE